MTLDDAALHKLIQHLGISHMPLDEALIIAKTIHSLSSKAAQRQLKNQQHKAEIAITTTQTPIMHTIHTTCTFCNYTTTKETVIKVTHPINQPPKPSSLPIKEALAWCSKCRPAIMDLNLPYTHILQLLLHTQAGKAFIRKQLDQAQLDAANIKQWKDTGD